MSSIGRSILAIVAGLVVGSVLIFAIQALNVYWLFRPPPGLDFSNEEAMKAYMENLPTEAFLVVLLSYAVGTFAAGWLAARLARRAASLHGLIIGILFLVAGILNLRSIHHPQWFAWVVLPLYLVMALLGAATARRPAAPNP